jgi:hypothetical protein
MKRGTLENLMRSFFHSLKVVHVDRESGTTNQFLKTTIKHNYLTIKRIVETEQECFKYVLLGFSNTTSNNYRFRLVPSAGIAIGKRHTEPG